MMKKAFKRGSILLVTCVMAMGLCLGLAACGANEESAIKSQIDKELSALKNPTAESLTELMGSDVSQLEGLEQYGIDVVEMMQHMFGKFDYKINDVKVNGDTAVAKLTVTNVDVEKVVTDAMANLQNDQSFIDAVTKAYSSGDQKAMYKLIFDKMYEALDAATETVSSDVELNLQKKDGKWTVDEDSLNNVVSGMYGGMDLTNL